MDDERTDRLRVLKLHGSLDWVSFARDQRRQRRGMHRLFSKKDENRDRQGPDAEWCGEEEYDLELYRIDDDDTLQGFINQRALVQSDHAWGLAGLGPRKRVSLVPGLGFVWEHARRALFDAGQVGIVGFSFSPFDRLAQIEFARVAAGRHAKGMPPQRITLIDPALARVNCRVPPWGKALIERVESVFRPVIAVGKRHEDFDWQELE